MSTCISLVGPSDAVVLQACQLLLQQHAFLYLHENAGSVNNEEAA